MKTIKLIHKEPNSDCQEKLKECIVDDAETGKFIINNDTLVDKLPEKVINSFLDLLSRMEPGQRSFTLNMIKKGSLVLECTDD